MGSTHPNTAENGMVFFYRFVLQNEALLTIMKMNTKWINIYGINVRLCAKNNSNGDQRWHSNLSQTADARTKMYVRLCVSASRNIVFVFVLIIIRKKVKKKLRRKKRIRELASFDHADGRKSELCAWIYPKRDWMNARRINHQAGSDRSFSEDCDSWENGCKKLYSFNGRQKRIFLDHFQFSVEPTEYHQYSVLHSFCYSSLFFLFTLSSVCDFKAMDFVNCFWNYFVFVFTVVVKMHTEYV